MRPIRRRKPRVGARRICVVGGLLRFESPPDQVLARADFVRQHAMWILKAQLVGLPVVEADRRARAERRTRSILKRADDGGRVRETRQARRPAEKRPELRLLPGPPKDRRRGESDEVRDRRSKRQYLDESIERAGRSWHHGRETRDEDREPEE